jgi:3-keto-5-aminohexanoate cleavage enzyme
MKKIIVNFTPTGMIPKKSDTPYVPVSVEEIVRDVRIACDYGITMVHLHARDVESQTATYRKEIYGEIISGIRNMPRI